MKKTLAVIGIVSALASSGTIYPATMVVTDIRGGIASLETSTGYIYQIDAEDYTEGDMVSLLMWSMGTDSITDDVVISARCAGYWLNNNTINVYEE